MSFVPADAGAARTRHAAATTPKRLIEDAPRYRTLGFPVVQRLLVANRGEIALRIFRACREEGIATVAVVAPDDREALHGRSADETVEIASYLDPAEIVR